MKSRLSWILIALIMPALLLSGGTRSADLPQRFSGRVAAIGGPAAGQSAYFKFQVGRLATRDELRRLDSIFVHDGEEALLAAVAETDPAGWMSFANGLRYYLRVITISRTEDGSTLIRALTDRPIQFGEIARGSRSKDYAFGVVELHLDEDGRGGGSLIPAARIRFKDGNFEVENFQVLAYRLIRIRQEKIKKK